jgi:TolB-like protein
MVGLPPATAASRQAIDRGLPFANMSGDPEQEYFADGMVEEIITALSRIRWLFVIARNSTFTYKGQAIDVKQVGRELGVRYVLEGSVRKAGGRVRISAQLVQTESGAHLWADRFDGLLEDVFELQDQVAISVAGVIEPTLLAAEIRRSSQRPTDDLSAYDLYLRALPSVTTYQWTPLIDALDLLRQAIERDPDFASALALAAYCHASLDGIGRVADRDANRQKALDLAHRAVRVAGDDALALAATAHVLGYFNEDIHASNRHHRPLACAQPEPCLRMAVERLCPTLCRQPRACDRTLRALNTPQPPRPALGATHRHWHQRRLAQCWRTNCAAEPARRHTV